RLGDVPRCPEGANRVSSHRSKSSLFNHVVSQSKQPVGNRKSERLGVRRLTRNTDRPALQRLLDDVQAGKVDIIVVYKVDRLTRSLADFAKLVELFDQHNVSFVSVTQQFNTTTSMGRLTLNVLLSFAQFEREVTS